MAFAGDDLYTNEAIMSLGERKDIELKYLYYYFSSLDWGLLASGNEKIKGKTLNKKSLSEIPVAYLPLSEQRRIVERLDALSENVRKLEDVQKQVLTECDALKQAMLREIFE
jgi:type I restriction enzyme S subunit